MWIKIEDTSWVNVLNLVDISVDEYGKEGSKYQLVFNLKGRESHTISSNDEYYINNLFERVCYNLITDNPRYFKVKCKDNIYGS